MDVSGAPNDTTQTSELPSSAPGATATAIASNTQGAAAPLETPASETPGGSTNPLEADGGSSTLSEAPATGSTPAARKPPLKSPVWNHFIKLPLDETNGEPRAMCKYCETSYAADPNKHGTGTLNRHLKKCVKNPHRMKKQSILAYTETSSGDGSVGSTRTLLPHTYNLEACRQALAEFVICDEQPFRVVEGRGFRKYSNTLEPRFPVPSRFTVARDCMKLFEDEIGNLQRYLKKSCSRVCLTIDTWTSVQNFYYMALTAYFIDENWQLQKRILNFVNIDNHKGDTVGKAIEKCLLSWGIEKVFTITVDNASSNDIAVAYLKKRLRNWNGLVCNGDYIHMRCCAHILNLVVTDGLKDMDDSISSIRQAIKYVRSSPSRFQAFKSLVESERLESKYLVSLDVPTRWNSTYLMLQTALKFQNVFNQMKDEDEGYVAHFMEDSRRGSPPGSMDWRKAEVFVAFLSFFYSSTLKFSGSLHVTSNTAFLELITIQEVLQSNIYDVSTITSDMARKMKAKYDKYWGKPDNFNPLLVMGAVLDPRYKLGFVGTSLRELYDDVELCKAIETKVKEALYKLYDEYSQFGCYANEQAESCISEDSYISTNTESSSMFSSAPIKVPSKILGQWETSKKLKVSLDHTSKVEWYLADSEVQDNPSFNILTWWKANASKYKVLSLIARDVLAIPVSTVASESAFSASGRVLDPFRSSMKAKTLELLICCQNWLNPGTIINIDPRNYDGMDEEDVDGIVAKDPQAGLPPVPPPSACAPGGPSS